MTGPLFVGVDASTSACKAIVFDEKGVAIAEARAPIALENPSPDAWEQDALAWSIALETSLAGAMDGLAPNRRSDVVAVAIAAQRETFVVSDPSFTPLAPAIVWMDARAAAEVEEVSSLLSAERIHDLSGKVPCTTPSLYKIRLLLQRLRPELARVTKRVSDVHGFLVRVLTGEHVTALGAADPMGLVDMRRRVYADELLAAAGIVEGELPRLVESGTVVGRPRPEIVARTGLPASAIVVAGTGDGQAAALGAGLRDPGGAYLNVGTAVVLGTPLANYTVSRGFRTLYAPLPGSYFAESDLKGGTFTLDWLSDRLLGAASTLVGGEARAARLAALEALAASVAPGSDGLFCLPYFQGVMNPYWNDRARGAFVGLTGSHAAHHFYRAILEGLAFEQRLALEGIEAEIGRLDPIVGMGGALDRPLVRDVLAGALGRSVTLAHTREATALGAAILAAIGCGHDAATVTQTMALDHPRVTLTPSSSASDYDVFFARYRRLYPALAAAHG